MMRSLTPATTCQGTIPLSGIVPKTHRSKWALVPALACALALLLLPQLRAQSIPTNWTEAARELARQISEKAGSPSSISLTIKNSSSLVNADVAEIRHTVETQLSSSGMRIVKPDQSVADIQLTLSQNVQGWLWVAEIHHGATSDAALVPVFTRQAPPLPGVSSTITLHKTFLWAQPDATPVLDVAVLGGGSNPNALLVLDSSMVSLYHAQQSHWELEQSQPIARSKPWPRDLRGRLMLGHDRKFEAYLPGMKCSGSADSGLTMECHNADDPWPLGNNNDGPKAFFGARNFFTGVMTSGIASPGPFFSAAVAQPDSKEWFFLQTSNQLHFGASASPGINGWGSNVAAIKSNCGRSWQLLTTGAGDYTQSDSVQATEVEASAITPAGAPVDFPGPVTALWPASDGNSAIAISKNLGTGKYEAFSLSITCR
ncbi:MAG TPA: hypothetical protein VK699_18890 [Terriglobales bacterium]|jgi:hypothetical protein|nr:hypothetical protein [Terriglobales bacterium]